MVPGLWPALQCGQWSSTGVSLFTCVDKETTLIENPADFASSMMSFETPVTIFLQIARFCSADYFASAALLFDSCGRCTMMRRLPGSCGLDHGELSPFRVPTSELTSVTSGSFQQGGSACSAAHPALRTWQDSRRRDWSYTYTGLELQRARGHDRQSEFTQHASMAMLASMNASGVCGHVQARSARPNIDSLSSAFSGCALRQPTARQPLRQCRQLTFARRAGAGGGEEGGEEDAGRRRGRGRGGSDRGSDRGGNRCEAKFDVAYVLRMVCRLSPCWQASSELAQLL